MCYGYYPDAVLNAAVAANDRLAPEPGADGLITVQRAVDEGGVATYTIVRCGAVALEAAAAGVGDVSLFAA